MKTQTAQWIVFVSGHGARLARHFREDGKPRIEEVEALENKWQAPPREPPTSLSTPTTGHGYGSIGHVEDEHHRQYAVHLSKWFEEILQRNGSKEIVVFAPARMHGWLRKAYPPELARQVREGVGDFAHTDTARLADHPAVRDLVA